MMGSAIPSMIDWIELSLLRFIKEAFLSERDEARARTVSVDRSDTLQRAALSRARRIA